MSVTINAGSTPPLETFKQDLLKLAEILNRGGHPANLLTPGTVNHLKWIASDAGNTLTVADA